MKPTMNRVQFIQTHVLIIRSVVVVSHSSVYIIVACSSFIVVLIILLLIGNLNGLFSLGCQILL